MDNGLYYKFFEDSDSAMALMYRNGSILKANKKFVNLFESLSRLQVNNSGDSTGSALPLLVSDIPNISHISQFWSNLLPVINGTKTSVVFEIPFHFFGDNGDIHHWFNAHVWRVEDGNSKTPVMANNSGRPQQDWLIGIYLEDYTLVRQEEKKLLDGMESAEKAMEAKDQFLANMSHEIRTPIQTIIGTTELLQDTRLDHEQNEYSRQVKFSAEVLLTLVNDILDYSKIEAGKMELEHIEFDLEQAVEQAVEMITLEAHKKELSIVTVIPLEADIIIKGDPGKFRQIVINLVKNAVKFTKEGGITVSLALTNLNGREALRVSVADTGIGIREEARARLFSTFMQADASNTRRFGGTGLGLVISRNLVELMKGRIEMVPNEGGGSIFRFDIPLEPSEKKIAPLPPPERDGKLRILIVDDREEERNISSMYLRDLGYSDITLAESGEAALAIMRSAAKAGKVFHICLIDMIMPVMDGWRLAAEIHNDETIKQADLILMVPHGFMGADTKMTLLRWFKGYINKPVKRRSLAETIDAVLNEPQELEALTDPKDVADAAILNEANRGNQIPAQGAAPDKSVLPGKSALSGKSALPILIAEDHPVNQKLFAAILEKLGYSAILADDGIEAVEKALANNVALILMDIQMPRMNGYEAAGKLRKTGFGKPIIAVTASALSDEREHCLNAGIDDVLIKPFKRADVEKILLKWIKADDAEAAHNDEKPGKTEIPQTPEELSVSAIPVEGPDIVPVSKPDAVFDSAVITDTFMGNRELIGNLLPRFLERTQAQLKTIPDFKEAGDWESARREAHTIKGAAFTMSGSELGNAAAHLELAFLHNDHNAMETAYPLLQEAFSRFKKEAEDFLARGD